MLPQQGVQIQSLVRDLRSCKPHGMANKEKEKTNNNNKARLSLHNSNSEMPTMLIPGAGGQDGLCFPLC